MKWCRWLPAAARRRVLPAIERHALTATLHFYRIPRVLLAPNEELVALLAGRTGKATHLMKHGVDCGTFAPRPVHGRWRIGPNRIRGTAVGGKARAPARDPASASCGRAAWRANSCSSATAPSGGGSSARCRMRSFHGVLEGDELARAYASLDLFVFPSPSETFGLAVLEAMASGVAVLAMAQGGPGFVIEHGVSGWLAGNEEEFVAAGLTLARDSELRARLGCAARDECPGVVLGHRVGRALRRLLRDAARRVVANENLPPVHDR